MMECSSGRRATVPGVQQLSNAQLLLSRAGSRVEAVQCTVRTQGAVVRQVWPRQRAARALHQSQLCLRGLVKPANRLLLVVRT